MAETINLLTQYYGVDIVGEIGYTLAVFLYGSGTMQRGFASAAVGNSCFLLLALQIQSVPVAISAIANLVLNIRGFINHRSNS